MITVLVTWRESRLSRERTSSYWRRLRVSSWSVHILLSQPSTGQIFCDKRVINQWLWDCCWQRKPVDLETSSHRRKLPVLVEKSGWSNQRDVSECVWVQWHQRKHSDVTSSRCVELINRISIRCGRCTSSSWRRIDRCRTNRCRCFSFDIHCVDNLRVRRQKPKTVSTRLWKHRPTWNRCRLSDTIAEQIRAKQSREWIWRPTSMKQNHCRTSRAAIESSGPHQTPSLPAIRPDLVDLKIPSFVLFSQWIWPAFWTISGEIMISTCVLNEHLFSERFIHTWSWMWSVLQRVHLSRCCASSLLASLWRIDEDEKRETSLEPCKQVGSCEH